MDLGLQGRRAIVCGASRGLGNGCARALAKEGVAITIASRGADRLEQAAAMLREATGAEVTTVAADLTTEEGRAALLRACPEPDILVNNVAGPPAGEFRDWGPAEWSGAVNANMLTPIFLIRAVLDGMVARGFGRIVNITSHSVKMPLPHLALSSAARAGLTGLVAALSRQVVRHGVTINNLLPGQFETEHWVDNMKAQAAAAGITFEEIVKRRLAVNPANRLGNIDEFGAACAFLCSAQAGYIAGQNIVMDGGQYPGTF